MGPYHDALCAVAIAEYLHGLRCGADEPVFVQPFGGDFLVKRIFLEYVRQIYNLKALLENADESPFGDPSGERRLTAFEIELLLGPRTRTGALVAASCGLAVARPGAAAASF